MLDIFAAGDAAWTVANLLTPEWISLVIILIAGWIRMEKAVSNQSQLLRGLEQRAVEDRLALWSEIKEIKHDNENCSRERGQLTERIGHLRKDHV